jgi:hypothetical protein
MAGLSAARAERIILERFVAAARSTAVLAYAIAALFEGSGANDLIVLSFARVHCITWGVLSERQDIT